MGIKCLIFRTVLQTKNIPSLSGGVGLCKMMALTRAGASAMWAMTSSTRLGSKPKKNLLSEWNAAIWARRFVQLNSIIYN